jgi:hypothetical protein
MGDFEALGPTVRGQKGVDVVLVSRKIAKH